MNLPTKITVSRIVAIVMLVIALFTLSIIKMVNPEFETIVFGNSGINLVFFIMFIFFVIASYTDHLDGHLARKNNQVTALGKFLDPVADKLLINSLVIFLVAPSVFASYIPGAAEHAKFSVWCAIILVARDIVVDALRFIAAEKKVVIAANIYGKLKTVLEMVAIAFVLLNGWPFYYFDKDWPVRIVDIFVYLATIASVLSGVIYVYKYRYVLVDKKEDKPAEEKKEEK